MTEWTRSSEETSWRLTVGFVALCLFIWNWIFINVPELHDFALVYDIVLLVAMIIGGLGYASVYPFGVLAFPLLKEILEPTLTGVVVGLGWVVVGGQIARLSGFSIYQQLPVAVAFLFGFVVACTEEMLFRATVLPSLVRLLKSPTVGVIVTSLMFCTLHWTAFQASLPLLVSSFLFSIIISVLTLHYRTAWVAGVAHATYNLIAIYSLIGLPFP